MAEVLTHDQRLWPVAASLGASPSAAATARKEVPPSRAAREAIRAAAERRAAAIDHGQPIVRHDLERRALDLLADMNQPASYLGWTMVALASAFWRSQVAAVPPARRLLLLPHCMRRAEICPARYDGTGLLCQACGACGLAALAERARVQGYQVMIAEGSPAVMRLILSGEVDALLGAACLDVLERTLDKIVLAGIPCMAVPLVRDGCRNTLCDEDWIAAMIDTPHRPSEVHTRTYVHLMRAAAKFFEPDELERLAPRSRQSPPLSGPEAVELSSLDPLAGTEALAYDFLLAGGKHSRPFITLGAYDAMRGGAGTSAAGAAHVADLPDALRRIALAIEIFHKASLVHDDIEDGDALRYGRTTLHHRHGVPTAINVGDYLIGLGYRLVARTREDLEGQVVADVMAQFADAHTRLCEGQGAELLWRQSPDKRLTPLAALKVYALKTSPAFEAAILGGLRAAGPVEPHRETVANFARHLGVAYQLINDLDDWQLEPSAARRRGGDLLGGRPTVLWAIALQDLAAADQRRLLELTANNADRDATDAATAADATETRAMERLALAGELFARADVFRKAETLVALHHRRACAAADQITVEPLRRLFHFLADAILDRRPLSVSET